MEIKDLEFLAEGRVSHVYLLSGNRVLKLAHQSVPADKVKDEFDRCQIVSATGMPAPKALELVEVEGRHGIIFEWAGKQDLFKAKLGNPLNVKWGGRFMADAHVDLIHHQTDKLPDIKEEALRLSGLLPARTLEEKQYVVLERYLEELPSGNNICHMDFHPGNIIMSPDGYKIIDWVEAVKGPPEADLAMTSLILSMAETAPGTGLILRTLIPVFRKAFENAYRSHLLENLKEMSVEKIDRWTLAAAIFRMALWNIESEKTYLTALIQNKIRELET